MASKLISSLSFAAASTLGGAALAGGFVQPVEPTPAVAPIVVETSDWAGAYGGGSLGYTFGSDDVVGTEQYNIDGEQVERRVDQGEVDIKGATVGLHVGYRWQRDNWVYGPELAIEGGKVDEEDRLMRDDATPSDTGIDVESSVNYLASLRFKAGYVLNPETLIYGTVGVVHGDFDYKATNVNKQTSETEGFTDTGWSVGLGAERKLNDKLSIFAEWEYRKFNNTEIDFSNEVFNRHSTLTQATPEHHNIKVGVNYRF